MAKLRDNWLLWVLLAILLIGVLGWLILGNAGLPGVH